MDAREYIDAHQEQIVADIERLVRVESPSFDKERLDRCAAELRELFLERLGVEGEIFRQAERGDHLRFVVGRGESQVLILGHYDTVWEPGRLAYRVEGDRAYGPGILDMKAGLIQALWAVKALKETGIALRKRIVFLYTSDEEIGSVTSRGLIEEEARKSEAVLVMEAAVAETGALKTARKGVGVFRVRIQGRAAHAGNHPEAGASAIEEMARVILFLHSLADPAKGTTVNVGVAQGGTRANVVADRAELQVDVRVADMQEARRITAAVRGMKPTVPGCTLQVEGGVDRPPMVRTEATARLFEEARRSAARLGFSLAEASVGGGSDGNWTAALGIPTLDGLGAVGDGPHAEYEHIRIDQVPLRTALVAELVKTLAS